MDDGILYVPYNGAIKLLEAFQEEAGLLDQKEALKSVLFLNQAMVSDARQGLRYSVSDRADGCVRLPELYEAHLEKLQYDLENARSAGCPDVMTRITGVDPVPLREIMAYMEQNYVAVAEPAEALTIAISAARSTYSVFGSGKTGELHIPAVYPKCLWEIKRRHIHLKAS